MRILLLMIFLFSCKDERKIKYSGFDDLMFGSQTINLYENGEFSIELGIGFRDGIYRIYNDTIFLEYNSQSDLPKKFLLKENEIISLDFNREVSIKRTDNNK